MDKIIGTIVVACSSSPFYATVISTQDDDTSNMGWLMNGHPMSLLKKSRKTRICPVAFICNGVFFIFINKNC